MKSGRTHLMDAVPVTLGQEFAGYAAQVRQGSARVRDAMPRLGQVPLGGTATGTGLNTHPEFAARVREYLTDETGLTISAPADHFEAQAARDGLVEASGALKVVAVSLTKIANDLRLMGSGPRAGLSEIFLPELQKGSSIMPGKVNPVIPEVVTQVAAQVIGNDLAITVGGMGGHFELNVYIPLMARNLLDSIELLSNATRLLAEKCVDGIEANRERNEEYAESTLSAATALNPFIGYDKATEIVKEATPPAVRCARSRAKPGWTSRSSIRRSTSTRWQSRTTPAEAYNRLPRGMFSAMRTLAALVVASLALAIVGVAAAHETARSPSVKLVRVAPVVVSGTGFGSRASVRVTVTWKAMRLVKTVRASSTGAPSPPRSRQVAYPAYACGATRIEAVAGNGLHAAWRPGSKSCYAIAVPIAPTG